MFQEDEILMLALGVGILAVMLINYSILRRICSFNILVISFCVLLAGWTLTVFEVLFAYTLLNFLEHLCYAVSAIFMAVWFRSTFGKTKGGS